MGNKNEQINKKAVHLWTCLSLSNNFFFNMFESLNLDLFVVNEKDNPNCRLSRLDFILSHMISQLFAYVLKVHMK